MKLKILAAFCAFVAIIAPLPALANSTLTDVSIVLSNQTASQPTDVVITYRTAATLVGAGGGAGDYLLNFAVGVQGLTLAAQSNCLPGSVSVTIGGAPLAGTLHRCSISGNPSVSELNLILGAGQTVSAGSLIEVTIRSSAASAGPTPGTYSPSTFRTIYNSSTEVGTPAAPPTFTVNAPPAPVPTMTEWAMILLGLILAGGAAVLIQRRRQLD
ncbi:IPTL-CTERM sorting domain-containing protein [Brevundimonas sp. TWP2-3-4b1]|uniref:IPTL-CTERM sorting domain-containing protein n=1 Tax=Brevundimonas sp. TWP2-3-4b1 TaxID=2804580 RepID=UPI003CF9DA38